MRAAEGFPSVERKKKILSILLKLYLTLLQNKETYYCKGPYTLVPKELRRPLSLVLCYIYTLFPAC